MVIEESAAPGLAVRQRGVVWVFVLLTIATPLLYHGYTQHVWEDFLITFRHSRNLVEGRGLVFTPGERVQGFTSPINTLLPALFYWLGPHNGEYGRVVWLYTAVSALALAGGVFAVLRRGLDDTLPVGWAVLFGCWLLVEPKTIAYAGNGQEAGFLVLFTLWTLALTTSDIARQWRWLAVAWAGLQYTRPDGVVYAAASCVVAMVGARGERRAVLVGLLKAAALAAAMYLPWLVWSWWYYGSPIPYTITAKGGSVEQLTAGELVQRMLNGYTSAAQAAFHTIYVLFDWGARWDRVAMALGVVASVYCLIPGRDRFGRLASLYFVLLCGYLAITPYLAPWYLPGAAVVGALVVSRAVFTVASRLSRLVASRRAASVAAGVAVVVAAGLLIDRVTLFAHTAWAMKQQQRLIETGSRVHIGQWLATQTQAGESVYLEPLGYIGYYSRAKMLDWPGLVSPEVVAARRASGGGMMRAAMDLQPTFMVLRPGELAKMRQMPGMNHYQAVITFDVSDKVAALGAFPGHKYLQHDAVFVVLRRGPAKP